MNESTCSSSSSWRSHGGSWRRMAPGGQLCFKIAQHSRHSTTPPPRAVWEGGGARVSFARVDILTACTICCWSAQHSDPFLLLLLLLLLFVCTDGTSCDC